MKKTSLILICFLLITSSYGQNIHFLKSYGNSGYDYGRDIKQTVDTGYIATGSSSSFTSGNADLFLLKIDSLGNFQWSRNYGGPDSDWGIELTITHDSGYAVAGYTNSFGAGGFDFYLVRTETDGTPIWEKTYGGSDWDKADALVQLPDSGFVIVGETYSFGNGGRDAYIVRTNKNGDTIWTKTYGGPDEDWASGVIVDGDSIVICGGTESFSVGLSDGFVQKMDFNGNIGWTKIIGQDQDDYFTSLVKFGATYYLSGTRDYHNGIYLGDFWLYRLSTDGQTIVCDTTIQNASHELEIAHDIVVAQLGNIYFSGQTKSFGYSTIDNLPDAFVGKLLDNYFTAYDYRQNFGEAGSDIAWGIDKCYDNGIVAVGDLAYGSTGGNNMFIIKINKTANFPADNADYDIFGNILNNITLEIINPSIDNNEFSVFPNPTNSLLNVRFQNGLVQKVELFTIGGALIFSESNCDMIDMSEVNSGLYILKVSSENYSASYKVTKL